VLANVTEIHLVLFELYAEQYSQRVLTSMVFRSVVIQVFRLTLSCSVPPGEFKHKFFKGLAYDVAPSNLIIYLFIKDVACECIRLGLAGIVKGQVHGRRR
jgi:hypothetical protein